jgi:hypothetical protein
MQLGFVSEVEDEECTPLGGLMNGMASQPPPGSDGAGISVQCTPLSSVRQTECPVVRNAGDDDR